MNGRKSESSEKRQGETGNRPIAERTTAAGLTETIGKFLVDLLREARTSGVFASLPKADRCELGVEDPTTGEFGWPAYAARGKKNLVT